MKSAQRRVGGAVLALALGACGSPTPPQNGTGPAGSAAVAAPTCPADQPAPAVLPGVTPAHQTAAYWVARSPDADAPLLTAGAIRRHDAALRAGDAAHLDRDAIAPYDLATPEPPARLEKELGERLAFLESWVEEGKYVDAEGAPVAPATFARRPLPAAIGDEVRVALEAIPVRCGPRVAGLFKEPIDPAFDRNNCSTLRPQEPVMILAPWGEDLWLVRTPYALGWIERGAALSPPLSAADRQAFTRGERWQLDEATTLAGVKLPAHSRVVRRGDQARIATAEGPKAASPPSGATPTVRPLTRRAFLEEAFSYLGSPYGWGGEDGGRDCSRFLLDAFGAFDLDLPRHSAQQARATTMRIDVPTEHDRRARLALLDAAHRRGIVLAHFPGHILLYLGRDESGRPMALHAFAEYLETCPEGGETRRVVSTVRVSDLSLGEGTSRRSFLERITALAVVGGSPGPELLGAVTRRAPAPIDPAAACKGEPDVELLTSPRRAHPGAPLRAIASSPRDLGSAALYFVDPKGQVHRPDLQRLGGPPFGYWGELEAPARGTWKVFVGEGDRVEACTEVEVHERGDVAQVAGSSVWRPQRAWDAGTEGLFAAFIERLFAYPLDDRTWSDLSTLLADRDHNLLHGYLGANEDDTLRLQPDCADLPYFLRAYFSWKLRLPFAFRRCNRGIGGKAPYCDPDLYSSLKGVEAKTEVGSFNEFARRNIADGVHSGSGRTAPDDEETDYYPVPLTREGIHPGAIFADPYGHLFVVAGWVPQTTGDYGILIGADAQPDGTIGRRRFWPGSFLFTPDTSQAGAGFKGFRPLTYRGGRVRPVKNAAIADTGLPPFSLEQYEGTRNDFYDRVEALINPRPLDPTDMLTVLVDALHEQVKRRVVSIQNGIEHKREHPATIAMPRGHSIFETTGAWENFSTPSRDMRLLIAMDTVRDFPAAVRRRPERFGLSPGEVDEVVAQVEAAMTQLLTARSFAYVSSAGAPVELTLADVMARAEGLEMAYNPNDCVEVRWAAPQGSDEAGRCSTHAPGAQRDRMRKYRSWFEKRQRPAR